ncbi:MAG: hypothetical protein ACE5OY_02070 [Candidatus Bathyarchaeia archaeon]
MSEKKPIRVRVKIGSVEAEIECDEDQLETAVSKLVSSLREYAEVAPPARPSERTCRGVLDTMLLEGWFKEYRVLGEVCDELARRGYHYDRTAVAHALLDLLKEGKLSRTGKPRRYRYVEKKPIIQS